MNKVVSTIVSIILLLSFAMGIYCAGTNKTYDFKKHLESISRVTEEIPSIEELEYIWTSPIINVTEMKLIVPRSGFFARFIIGEQGVTDEFYAFDWFDVLDWGIFEPINQFISGVVEFMGRVVFTGYWGATYIQRFFQLVGAVTPFSGLVERSV